jgi:hypothetical protein
MGLVFGGFVLLFLYFLIFVHVPAPQRTAASTSKSPAIAESQAVVKLNPHEAALESTSITKYQWYKEAFGTVMEVTLTIKNDSDYPVKDMEIVCVQGAPSGTILGTNTETLYDIVPAHTARVFRRFNMGFIDSQSATSKCRIKNVSVA